MLSGTGHAAVAISSAATQNMSCTNGLCTPTAADAVLNASDLQTMLVSGSVTVTTTGSGIQARDINVKAAVSWSSSSALALDAYRSITVDQPVGVEGVAALILTANDARNGALSFGKKGSVTFSSLSSSLTINGTSYALENSIKSLSAAIASNPSGAFALANSYDASQDGTYTTAPIATDFRGTFEGLGNAIINLSVSDAADTNIGLFGVVDSSGTLRDISLLHASVSGVVENAAVGVLVGFDIGDVIGASASGVVSAPTDKNSFSGGLVGWLEGTVTLSHASTIVSGNTAGGLVGYDRAGLITQSYATGGTGRNTGANGGVGGLVGEDIAGSISNSYATGSVTTSSFQSDIGGFAGVIEGAQISASYSTGHVKRNRTPFDGGFVGDISLGPTFADCYWDTTTSGINRGVGNKKNESGITGMTTEQLQSGLPQGFNSSVWREKTKINGGLPYLIENLPR